MSTSNQFDSIVEAYADDLYRYAYYLCGNRHNAEDLVQETFTLGWRAFHQLREITAAKAWLIKTMRREHYKRAPVAESMGLEDLEGIDFTAFDAPLDHADRLDIEFKLRSLSAVSREVLLLQLLFGYSTQEISQLLSIGETAVCSRLHRARARLAGKKNAELAEFTKWMAK